MGVDERAGEDDYAVIKNWSFFRDRYGNSCQGICTGESYIAQIFQVAGLYSERIYKTLCKALNEREWFVWAAECVFELEYVFEDPVRAKI